jgi:transposase
MAVIADTYDHTVGVDTHARTHTYCVICAKTGAVIDTATLPASSACINRALAWVARRASGTVFAAVEGTSLYGATLTAALAAQGIPIGEVRPQPRSAHAHAGKSDPLDAEAAARSVLGKECSRVPHPRDAGDRAALRVLLAARSLIDHQRTANRNALTALLRTVSLGIDARSPLTDKQIAAVASWRNSRCTNAVDLAARAEAKRLAIAVVEQTRQLRQNHTQLAEHAQRLAPGLQEASGVGPVTAAILICAYSHRGRVRSEAAFAALGGIAPLPASSGNTTRHRLSRSGDRQLNRAIDIIVRTRMSFDPATRDYLRRGLASGKTNREIRRNLKRYVCRSMFRQLQAAMA